MNCSKCGNEIKEGSAFCGVCGTPTQNVETQTTPTPAPMPTPIPTPAPQAIPVQQPVSNAPKKAVSKNRYFLSVAPIQVKLMSIISLALALLCIALLAVSAFQIMDTPIDEVNVVNFGLKDTGFNKEYKSLMRDLRNATDDLEEYVPEEDEISSKDLRKLSALIHDLSAFNREPSLNNAKYTLESYSEIDIFDYDEESLEWLDNLAAPVKLGLFLVELGIYALMAIPAILLLIGFLIKNGALAITGAIFALLYTICFSQTTLLILTVLSVILAVVLLIISNKNYKKYKRNF